MENISVIIPSLDPDKRLRSVVENLIKAGFKDIIVINDGSNKENLKFFPEGEYITTITHHKNLGKGAALKTAYKYIIENRPDSKGVVTCDGDGQHLASDTVKVVEKMLESGSFVLGVRNFSLPNVPFKSRLGNRTSSLLLSMFCGIKTQDTQTGLRSFPAKLLSKMIQVKGDRFEYETNVLIELQSMNTTYTEVEIKTVYLDENKGSHYRPFADTMRILSLMIKYFLSSLISFIADILVFTLLHSYFLCSVLLSTVIARILSSAINFVLNKKVVFKNKSLIINTLLKYVLLAVPIMLISALGLKAIAFLFNIENGSVSLTFIKMIIDTILFILNFRIQKTWVFKNK